jgi:pimeloyl-ACP methyl ester carboxylesterase
MRHPNETAPFLGPDQQVVAGSIAEANDVRLGGLEQWVMIRGENLANPMLVVLHGGPGLSDTAFFRYHTPDLEKSFTMVYWDQRGAGRSYRSTISPSSLTVAQLLADLDELVDLLRERFGKDKVVILGHSWGSALGALYTARFPEKVAVYRIVPELQKLAVGDVLPIKAKGSAGFAVLLLDSPRAFVLGDPSLLPGRTRDPHAPCATWAFVLEPLGSTTRLHVRVRAEYEPTPIAALLRPLVFALHELMERKQLRTLKQRVEAHSSLAPALASSHGGGGTAVPRREEREEHEGRRL